MCRFRVRFSCCMARAARRISSSATNSNISSDGTNTYISRQPWRGRREPPGWGPKARSQKTSRLPSSLSQFEKTIGHGRGCRCGDGESLVDSFQDKPTIEAPGKGAEIARQMFGLNGAVRGQNAVFDVGEQSVRPAERGVAR